MRLRLRSRADRKRSGTGVRRQTVPRTDWAERCHVRRSSARRIASAELVTSQGTPDALRRECGTLRRRASRSSRPQASRFDEDITPKLTCRSPGLFRASAGDLASPRVASGAFVTLCSLAPGEYDHHLELEERQQPLLGKLVVEPRAYLGEAARRAIRNPGTVTLPRDLK